MRRKLISPTRVDRTCPICCDVGREWWNAVEFFETGDLFDIHQCESCDLGFVSNPPTPSDIGAFYEGAAGVGMRTRPNRIYELLRAILVRWDMSLLLDYIPAGSTIWDFGAGNGVSSVILSELGYQPIALDLYEGSQWTKAHIEYQQLDPSFSNLDSLKIPPPRAVILRHVLEHVHDPLALVRAFYARGADYVLVIVPNKHSRTAPLYGRNYPYLIPPLHLTHFSPPSLDSLFSIGGYPHLEYRKIYGIDEIVSYGCQQTFGHDNRLISRLSNLLNFKGVISAMSSGFAYPILNNVIRALYKRRQNY